MSLTYGFYNSIEGDRVYDAMQFGQIFDGIIKDGVYATYKSGMVVIASTNPGEVIIQPGRAWFNHTWSYNDANVIFPAPEPEILLDRIDALVLEVNEELSARENSFKWVTGTPSSVPERPVLTNTPTIHQYPLCYIHRYPETTIIQAKDITNMVGTSECPFATGVLEGIDLDAWINQWDDEFHNWENTTKSSFETWMLNQEAAYTAWSDALKSQMDGDVEDVEAWIETIKNIIDSETATHLQNEIDELRDEITSGSHIFINTINSELYGRNVTITTEEGITYTERFDDTGVAEFKSIPYVGNLNVLSSYGTQTAEAVINTPYFARYNFDIAFWAATCNIVGIPDYAGQTVTIKDSDSVIAGTVVLDSDGNGVFTAIRPDTYTFTLIYGGETMETTLSVTQETTYTVEIHSQSSVNLQDWLTAGGVTGTYNTFADVEADEKAVRRLMTIHDAVDYLAQSDGTDELISDVINSDVCAKWINLRDYALDTLSANADIKAVMDTADKYGYGEWVLEGQVPVMTSNTAPYGEAFASDTYSNYYPWKAFDDGTNGWLGAQGVISAGNYCGYKFVNPVRISEFKIGLTDSSSGNTTKLKIQASNDDTNWVDVTDEITFVSAAKVYSEERYAVNSQSVYKSYRMILTEATATSSGLGYKLQFYSWQPKGNVPVMTDDTAPYGEVIKSSQYSTSYKANFVFSDAHSDSGWMAGNDNSEYVGYKFVNPVCVTRVRLRQTTINGDKNRLKDFKIQGSNDGSTWTDLYTGQFPKDTFEQIYEVSNTSYYLYYRLYGVNSWTANYNIGLSTLQFYGREMKVSVPTMTSNTAPWGEASADGFNYGDPYSAFDKNYTRDYWAKSGNTGWLKYKFPNKVNIRFAKVWNYRGDAYNSYYIKAYTLYGSNDDVNYEELISGTIQEAPSTNATSIFETDQPYQYYRLNVESSSNFIFLGELELFGFDYSEYDWDTENPRHYLYDHGVEVEEIDTSFSSAFEKTDHSIYIKSGGTIIFTNSVIDMTDYSLERNVISQRFYNSGASGYANHGLSSNKASTVNTLAYKDYKTHTSDMPYNNNLDVSAISQSAYAYLSVGGSGTDYIDISEWWLE